jgi:5-(carboxyamino)imidazole ribonucleotide mutase
LGVPARKTGGILAASIIGAFDETVGGKVSDYKKELSDAVLQKVKKVKGDYPNHFD